MSAVIEDYKINLQEKAQMRLADPTYKKFRLADSFISKYKSKKVPFGFDGLGEFVYMRTYSRLKDDKSNEKWYETIERVVNGTYNMQKRWIQNLGLKWDNSKAQDSAQEMYDHIFNLRFTPPGRGLWAMGSPITEQRGIYAALNNCAFVSTENIKEDLSAPFTFLMDASMLGVGVGFDTRGEGKLVIKGPEKGISQEYVIPDTREGWVKSMKTLIESYFLGTPEMKFKYDEIRPAGLEIKGFGGLSSGPGPLRESHERIKETLEKEIDQPISATTIVDIQNHIGKCVVAGNVRRTAEIAFGDPFSEEYLDLKNYEKNPNRENFGWASNNSVFAVLGMDYGPIAERIRNNGEPGLAWLDNMQKYGRMKDGVNNKDRRAKGGNPCLEQTLESYELCCLVETYPQRHTGVNNMKDFLRTLKFSYLYAKTVTLGETHWPETNKVMLRNRRIGNSMSGIAQFVTERGVNELERWADEGYATIQKYDEIYSDWLAIPKSIKTTSVKPSGTVSLPAGATPGMHYPEDNFCIRRVRIGKTSPLIGPLEAAGYKIEPCYGDDSSLVVEFPQKIEGIRTAKQVSMWEQLSLAAKLQNVWADNQVSATVTFDPKSEGHQIKHALDYFQYQLKGVSFLPRKKEGAYRQMPYQGISEREYKSIVRRLKPLDFSKVHNVAAIPERFCDGEVCTLESANGKSEEDVPEN